VAVGSAIGVLKAKARRRDAGDAELTLVHGAMMGRAEHDEVIGVVRAALGAQLEVMHVDEGRVPAPGDDAAAFVAAEDMTAERRGDCLRGAMGDSPLWATHVGLGIPFRLGWRSGAFHVTDVLRVTSRHLDDRRVYFEPFAAGVLKAAATLLAERERELIAGSAGSCAAAITRRVSAVHEVFAYGFLPAEDVPRHEQQGRVIVQVLAALFPELVHGLTKGREGFGGDLEAQDVTDGARLHGITGSITSFMAGDEPLDLAHGSAFRSIEPVALRLDHGDASQLSRCRPG
jgi:hypothetical protein